VSRCPACKQGILTKKLNILLIIIIVVLFLLFPWCFLCGLVVLLVYWNDISQ